MKSIVTITEFAKKIEQFKTSCEVKTKIISIDGCGGAGKSTFAAKLAKSLENCPIVHTDDFATSENPLNWYPRLIEQVLIPLSQNKEACYQKYDWVSKCLTHWVRVFPHNYVIVEGVSSARSEFREFLYYSIFVEASRETRLQRGLIRDGQQSLNLWLQWMNEEDKYIANDNPKSYVNMIIDGESELVDCVVVLK